MLLAYRASLQSVPISREAVPQPEVRVLQLGSSLADQQQVPT